MNRRTFFIACAGGISGGLLAQLARLGHRPPAPCTQFLGVDWGKGPDRQVTVTMTTQYSVDGQHWTEEPIRGGWRYARRVFRMTP